MVKSQALFYISILSCAEIVSQQSSYVFFGAWLRLRTFCFMEGKNMKKTLSLLLAVLMLVAVIPVTSMSVIANAITITSTDLIYGDSDGLTRAEWLHNLAVVGDLDMDENAHMDNYFTDLTSKHKYYNDILLNLQYGLIDIQAGSELRPDDALTRDFAVSTLNALLSFQVDESESYTFSDSTELWSYTEETEVITEGEGETTEGTESGDESTGSESTDEDVYADFIEQDAAAKLVTEQRLKDSAQIAINRGWVELIDGAFVPETVVTKTEIEKMLEDAIDVLEVTVIDENYESVFEFTDDVIVVPDGTVISEDIENNTVTITDCPVELAVGNKFAVYCNGIPDVYLAEEITVNENVTTITISEVADEEAFTNVDAQGVIYDASQLQFVPADGIEMELKEYDNVSEVSVPEESDGFISYPELKLATKDTTKLWDLSLETEFKGEDGKSVVIKVTLKSPTISYSISKKGASAYLYCEEVSYEISGKTKFKEKEILLGYIPIPHVGNLEAKFKFDASGSIKCISEGSAVVGIAGAPKQNVRTISEYKQKYYYIEAEAEVELGVGVEFNVTRIPLFEASVYAETGLKGTVGIKKYLDDKKPYVCAHLYAFAYFNIGAKVEIDILGIWKTEFKAEKEVVNHTNSPYRIVQHYEDQYIVPECTRGQNPNVDMVNYDYFTRTNSRWFGSGWSGWNGTSGINAANEIVPVFSYKLNETNGATITSYNIDSYYLNVPEKVDGYTVVGIGSNAFKGKKVGHIVLPDTVTTIESYAFANCNNLVSVDITDSVTTIAHHAFYQCYNLREVSLPKNLITLGNGAFGYTAIPSVKIPKSLEDGTYSTYSYTYNGTNYIINGGPFVGCDNLKQVTFEDGTVRIADYLFSGCTGLETINIPSGTEEIQAYSFADCFSLKNVNIPTSVLSIGNCAFYRCFGLTGVTIPDSVTTIGYSAFENCYNLKNVKLSKGLLELGYKAFSKTAIESIEIPKSLDKADWSNTYGYTYKDVEYDCCLGPFGFCDNLKTVTFENGTTQIAQYLFAGCTGLEEITIPDTVTTIEQGAFEDCLRLNKVSIGNAVTTIGVSAFYKCVSLTGIAIPNSVTTIDKYAFEYCYNLKKVDLSKNIVELGSFSFAETAIETIEIPKSLDLCPSVGWFESYTYCDEVYNYLLGGPFYKCEKLKTVTFESGTTQIAQYLFTGCTGLEKITIPDTVTIIERGAFEDCLRLSDVKIGESVTLVELGAFERCVSLISIEIPDSVREVEQSAFNNCYNLKDIRLSKGLLKIGLHAFGNTAIEEIEIPKSLDSCSTGWSDSYTFNDKTYDYFTSGPFYRCEKLKTVTFERGTTQIAKNLFAGCVGLEKITIPDTVTAIEDGVFLNCVRLYDVQISDSVTTIGRDAFNRCVSLPEISIPDSVVSMGSYMFENCTSLETVKLPSSIVEIPYNTFYNCSSLKTIELPKTVENIRQYAFYGCSSLESLNFADASLKLIEDNAFQNCSVLKEAVLPETVEEIGNQAFMGCSALEKVYIPESTKTFGTSVFQGCEALSDVTIKDYGVTTIGDNTFKDCASLEKIELPKGLTKIGASAFMNATSLKEVIIPESVTSIDSTAFSYPEKTTIYGKTGSLAESFATENGFKFVPNGIMTEGILIKDGNEQVVLEQGETYRASFEIYPEDSNEVITLTSDNNNVDIYGHDIYADKWSAGDSVITASTASGLTYNFNVHIRSVKNIEIVTNPQKTTYAIGEEFDKTGMVVRVNYNDETTKDIMNFTVEGFDSSVEGTNTITVKWTSARGYEYTDTLELNIVDLRPKLTEIVVEALPTKLNYELREKVDYTGLVIMGLYTDGTMHEITDYTLSGYNALKTGVQTVTVAKGELKTEFTVAVGTVRTIASYEVIEDNGSFKRAVGDSFTADDVKLKIVYDDGTFNIIGSGFSITTVDTSTQGTKNAQLFYNDEVIEFIVVVESFFEILDFETKFIDDNIVTDMKNVADLTNIVEVKAGYTTEIQESYNYGEVKRLGTGSVVKVYNENQELVQEYNVVVLGDVNGDSICDALDLMLIELARHESNNVSFEGVYFTAANLAEDSEINIDDFNAVVNKAIA